MTFKIGLSLSSIICAIIGYNIMKSYTIAGVLIGVSTPTLLYGFFLMATTSIGRIDYSDPFARNLAFASIAGGIIGGITLAILYKSIILTVVGVLVGVAIPILLSGLLFLV